MKGIAPCRLPLKLDDSMIRWIADTLDPIGGYMACLLGSILSAWGGLGPHLGGLGYILGMAWLLSWPGDPGMGWIAFRPG